MKSYSMDADSGYICTVTHVTHHKTVKSLNVILEIRAYVILKCQSNRGAGNFRQGMAVSFPSQQTQEARFPYLLLKWKICISLYTYLFHGDKSSVADCTSAGFVTPFPDKALSLPPQKKRIGGRFIIYFSRQLYPTFGIK